MYGCRTIEELSVVDKELRKPAQGRGLRRSKEDEVLVYQLLSVLSCGANGVRHIATLCPCPSDGAGERPKSPQACDNQDTCSRTDPTR
jgi:hypothetical protein